MMYVQNDATQDNVSWGFTVYKMLQAAKEQLSTLKDILKQYNFLM
jgi:hypothetical protein